MGARSSPGRFDKYEGLGNDFVIVEVVDDDAVGIERAVHLCDRRHGVGADGVLLLLPARSPQAAARMKVINADGSVPEMCGNGLRCLALHLANVRGLRTAVVETDAGMRAYSIDEGAFGSAAEASVTVAMGPVIVEGQRSIEIDGEGLQLWVATAGNPHAVLFGSTERERVHRLGPRLATHSAFPCGTNVGFATERPGGLDLVVWERGVGPTLACGTGACAAVAVGVQRGMLGPGVPAEVRLPGGSLWITHDPKTHETTMRGLARHVFRGEMTGD
jgi:diaminopimelate epimerase